MKSQLPCALHDIFIFTETWLTNNVMSSELGFHNYDIYRYDRTTQTSMLSRGGGVLIAVRNNLQSKLIVIENNSIELLFVLLNISNLTIIIGSVYIPNKSNENVYNSYFDYIETLYKKYQNAIFLLLGDFNLPSANFSNAYSYFDDKLALLNLSQLNCIKNNKNTILDYVLTNSTTTDVDLCINPIMPIDIYHPPLTVTFTHNITNYLSCYDYTYNWRAGNYISIIKYLGNVDFIGYFNKNSIENCLNLFYYHIRYIMDHFIPKIQIRESEYPKWFSKELRTLIKQKKIAHNIYKYSNNITNYQKFSNLRTKCKHLRHRDYTFHIQISQNAVKSNPKLFWKFVNENNKNSHKLPNSMSYLDKEVNNGNDIVNLFKEYFSNTYITNDITCPETNLKQNNIETINKIELKQIDIFNELWNISYNTAIGPDKISPLFLKKCAFILTPAITSLFNKSLLSGIFPEQWKSSYITPIFKKGNRCLINNYRPISKLSIIPKLFSKLVNNIITPLCNKLLSNDQHGFRQNRSTITNLCIFKHAILDSFEMQSQTDVIYTDMEKAFDRVNHKLLINKLKTYGFTEPLLSWFYSFISGRTQIVKYKNYISEQILVTSGVPPRRPFIPNIILPFYK